jgi:hypothetical protein
MMFFFDYRIVHRMIARRTAFRFCASGLILFPALVGAAVCPATVELPRGPSNRLALSVTWDLSNSPELTCAQSGESGVDFSSLLR